MVEAIESQNTSSSSSSKPKEEPKKEEPKPEPETERPKPEKPKPVKKTNLKREDPHGTNIDNNQNPKYWDRKNVGYLIDQLSLHGIRLKPSQVKGKDKLKKAELVQMIKDKLKII